MYIGLFKNDEIAEFHNQVISFSINYRQVLFCYAYFVVITTNSWNNHVELIACVVCLDERWIDSVSEIVVSKLERSILLFFSQLNSRISCINYRLARLKSLRMCVRYICVYMCSFFLFLYVCSMLCLCVMMI